MLPLTIEVYADTLSVGRCRYCDEAIAWLQVVGNGKRMPFSREPVALRTRHEQGSRRLIEEIDLADCHFKACGR